MVGLLVSKYKDKYKLIERLTQVNSIAVIGEAMVELSDQVNELKFSGDSLNTAIYLKRELNNKEKIVAYFTALGDDSVSEMMINYISSEGISTDYIEKKTNLKPGAYKIQTNNKGDRSFKYWRNESAAKTLFSKPNKVKFEDLLKFDLIYISAISVAILPSNIQEDLLNFIFEYQKKGGLIVFDSNYRKILWKSKIVARSEIKKYWKIADVALPSVDDEKELFDLETDEDVVNNLVKLGVKFGALKRGDQGPYSLCGNKESNTYNIVSKVEDTTAAGDSFNGAYLASLINGFSHKNSLISGHKLASKVIKYNGAIIPFDTLE